MNFSTKIFITSFMIAILSCALITVTIYSVFKKDIEVEFLSRYKVDENIVSNTFHQLEVASDNTNRNAVNLLLEIEKTHGIPGDKELDSLAKKLGVNGFYVINSHGKFIRSSDIPVKLQHNSLFSYDPSYENLIKGTLDVAITPIIPSYPYDVPAKLTMIPNHDRTLILESSTHLEYIEKILHQVIVADKNIKSIGLYTPTGYELGSITSGGEFHQGRRNINKKLFLGDKIGNKMLTISTKILLTTYCVECEKKGVSKDGEYYYILTFQVSLVPLLARLSVLKTQASTIFVLMLILNGFLSRIISRTLVARIKKINTTVNNIIDSKNLESEVDTSGNDEISKLAIAFNKMIFALKQSQNELIEAAKARSIGEIANQVAHDIRSPLAAINIALSNVSSISENKRIMIKNASKRINDIANNLLLQSKNNYFESALNRAEKNSYPELLSVVLDNMVSEKRYEYYNTKVNIRLDVSDQSYSCCSSIHLASFKRVLSNLINNSIEAISYDGFVIISLKCDTDYVEVAIEDNGRGMPPEILPRVIEHGFSFNKENGAGFGLAYANQCITQLKGTMTIHSDINVGTKVTIKLPRSNNPTWLCEKLNVKPHSEIMVLDDDLAVHDIWNERFSSLADIKIVNFTTVSDLFQYRKDEALYLIDHELLTDETNGLEVIEKLKLNNNSILITNCFEDLMIRNKCEKLGIKIIPKPYILYIPIVITGSNDCSKKIVFIDDDEMMRNTWTVAAEESGKSIETYSSFNEFSDEIKNYSKDTVIYIDSNLGENKTKGEFHAKNLFANGFTEIYLSTGTAPEQFCAMPWIKSIIGKEPPFQYS